MNGLYKEMLEKSHCWCMLDGHTRKICPLGKDFLEALYSWSDLNPLNPQLAWKICEPCKEKNRGY